MDIKLAREIYSGAWYMDPMSLETYSKTLDYFRNGGKMEQPEVKANNFGVLMGGVYNATKIQRMEEVPAGSIALYNFDGPITKYGGYSHYGTTEIAKQFAEMEANDNIIGHIFFIESGGGSANAIKYIRDVSAKANRSKPLVTYCEDMMASAAMYIASDSDYIFANKPGAMVGSIGAMIAIDGYANKSEGADGVRHLRIYASQSINKNSDFEEALNNLNFKLVQDKLLDPLAEEFILDMEANRPNITAEQKTGDIYRASEVVGTLIDGIGTMQDAIDKVTELAQIKSNALEGD
jgi:ClpP class serine protease